MNIELHVEPQTPPQHWYQFLKEYENGSIALDGYVAGAPMESLAHLKFNLNHHEDVANWATKSTAAQALTLVRQKIFKLFKYQKITPKIYVNDCDQDVCLSVFILKNPHMAESVINPILNRLVYMNDCLDSTAGTYPFPVDLPSLEKNNWIFEPYTRFRVSGGIDSKNTEAYTSVISDVEGRIMAHITGSDKSLPLDTAYEKLGGVGNWALVKEVGLNAKLGVFNDGYEMCVSARQRPDGRWNYVLTKQTDFVPIDLSEIAAAANAAERQKQSQDHWGGKTNVIGSPRVYGSCLSPDELTKIIEENKSWNLQSFSS